MSSFRGSKLLMRQSLVEKTKKMISIPSPTRNGPVSAVLLATLLCLVGSGCVRLGSSIQHPDPPANRTSVATILNALAENQRFDAFRATGTFILDTPNWEAIQTLPLSHIAFRRPGDFYITGRKHATKVVLLAGTEEALLMELPRRKEFYFVDNNDERSGTSYLELARDLFFFGLPSNITERNTIRVQDKELAQGYRVILETKSNVLKNKYRWRIEVTGLPWVITKRDLISEDGTVIATTRFDEYRIEEGVLFPKSMTATLPSQNASMRFEMKKINVAPELDESRFALRERMEMLEEGGYRRADLNEDEWLDK